MAKQPLVSIPLDLPDVRVLKTELSKQNELIITVESTLTTTNCQHCGRLLTKEHAVDDPILLRHLPILGHPVYIRIRPKRFRCPDCDNHPTTTQRLSWYDPRALHTIPYERHLLLALVNSTVEDVVRKEDVSYDAVLGVLDAWIATSIDWDSVGPFAVLGIDEIALLKGHRDFIAVITAQLESGEVRVLALLLRVLPLPRWCLLTGDDAGLARVTIADEAQQLHARVVLLDHAVADVGPVEAGDDQLEDRFRGGLFQVSRQAEAMVDHPLRIGRLIAAEGEDDHRDVMEDTLLDRPQTSVCDH